MVLATALLSALVTVPSFAQNDDPSFGTKIIGNRNWTRGVAVPAYMLPQATGGTGAITYSLSPSLPSGLTFTASTRTITGDPQLHGVVRHLYLHRHRRQLQNSFPNLQHHGGSANLGAIHR